ncbi:alpha/beta hydrolase [Consotaella aegiceratis]|uniref:alpha/beta hydrolase n=1 Tax=Consotaella aegiceratis TaxID=3097961 RepID=UPI002F3F3921
MTDTPTADEPNKKVGQSAETAPSNEVAVDRDDEATLDAVSAEAPDAPTEADPDGSSPTGQAEDGAPEDGPTDSTADDPPEPPEPEAELRDILVETPGNPLPDGIVGGWLTSGDGVGLRYAVCPSAQETTRGTVLLLQGRNEAIEKYFETISDLSRRGYLVATLDWRGQGGSDRLTRNRRRGHVGNFKFYLRDLEAFLEELDIQYCPQPRVVLGHSMGGLLALMAAPSLEDRIERIVAAAPMIGLPIGGFSVRTAYWLTTLLRALGLGKLGIRGGARAQPLLRAESSLYTSDQKRLERNFRLVEAAPWLFLGSPSLSWVRAAIIAMRRFERSDAVATLRMPTLIVTAGDDRVVSSRAARRLAWRMRCGHGLSLAGARHELLQEADRYREPFLAAFEAFAGAASPDETNEVDESQIQSALEELALTAEEI